MEHNPEDVVHASADAGPETDPLLAAPPPVTSTINDLHQHPQPPAEHEKSSSDEDAEDHREDNIETDSFYDDDSAFGGTDYESETATLSSDILRYREENGRTYHSYGTT